MGVGPESLVSLTFNEIPRILTYCVVREKTKTDARRLNE